MFKFYCDRCGKDITKEEQISITLEYIGVGEPSEKAEEVYDICHECLQKLKEVLEPLQNSDCEENNDMENN